MNTPSPNALQVIVTSYMRPLYLEQTLRSLLDSGDVEVTVMDGGGSAEALAIARELAHHWHLMDGNPGADVMKNQGIRLHVTHQPYFAVTSDDLVAPPGWAADAVAQFRLLNDRVTCRECGLTQAWPERDAFCRSCDSDLREVRRRITYPMMACPTEEIVERHTFPEGQGPNRGGCGVHYHKGPQGAEHLTIMTTSISMCCGTIMDTGVTREVGLFPEYGKSGQGDIAISRMLRRRGYEIGYFRAPVMEHLGRWKARDYPEYSAAFAEDDAVYQPLARAHKG